jgi:hypothetical protein
MVWSVYIRLHAFDRDAPTRCLFVSLDDRFAEQTGAGGDAASDQWRGHPPAHRLRAQAFPISDCHVALGRGDRPYLR